MAIKMEQQTVIYKSQNRKWKKNNLYPAGISISHRNSCRVEIILSHLCIGRTDIIHSYLLKQEQPPWCVGCHAPYSVKHLLIDCINLTPKRQYCFTVNNIKELFEHVEVDKILAFLKAVGLYKKI